MSELDSSDEEYITDEGSSQAALRKCQNKKPVFLNANKSNSRNIKGKIKKMSETTSSRERQSSRVDNRKQLEDYFKDLSADFSCMMKKFETILEAITNIYDRLDDLEKQVSKKSAKPAVATYASALKSPEIARLEKVEQFTSEEERKRRILEVSITHPDIDPSQPNLPEHVKNFMAGKLRMENREIDSQFTAKKLSRRNNTVLVSFSEKKFKKFIFQAMKRLRQEDSNLGNDLYVNDNMTLHNYSLLKKMKQEKKRRSDANLPSFESLYVFEGKVFARKNKEDRETHSTWISNKQSMEKFFEMIDSAIAASNSQT